MRFPVWEEPIVAYPVGIAAVPLQHTFDGNGRDN